jgi:hypothetical protein
MLGNLVIAHAAQRVVNPRSRITSFVDGSVFEVFHMKTHEQKKLNLSRGVSNLKYEVAPP